MTQTASRSFSKEAHEEKLFDVQEVMCLVVDRQQIIIFIVDWMTRTVISQNARWCLKNQNPKPKDNSF